MAGGPVNGSARADLAAAEDDAEVSRGLRKHLFIINPVSFRAETEMEAFISRVKDQFEQIIKEEYDIRISRFPRHAIRTVRKYITQAGPEQPVRVYAVGGDGILFDCLNGIVGLPNAELAPVPYGHNSDFVRAFGEGREDTFRNIPLLAAAPTRPTDILHCGSNYALNLCLVGLESASVFKTVAIQQKLKSLPRFIRNSIRIYNLIFYLGWFIMMFDHKLLNQEYTISIDGENLSGSYASVNIANGPCYGGDKNAVITAVPDDGLMDVLMLKGMGTLVGLRMVFPYTTGHYDYFPKNIVLKRGKVISIRSPEALVINLDGETFLDTHITVELIPGAVNIVAPDNLSYHQRRVFRE
jgi:diacylglycerol kinase family enzyme